MIKKPTVLIWESMSGTWKFTITLYSNRLMSDADFHSKDAAEIAAFKLCQALDCRPNFKYVVGITTDNHPLDDLSLSDLLGD